ncbi:MAG: hypothetical protein VX447_03025 [Pseudomonadota bacterium]|uniref:hypothetical protein n=1 Tax=Gallaecimonas pentaromativorans TaxID=584787 RepID=UPI0012EDCE52|nr:hypothetical protein [Gallaecimonas pentaromativorans]MED5523714.1 hypothetical protein [Pseudomonadota bacterium]
MGRQVGNGRQHRQATAHHAVSVAIVTGAAAVPILDIAGVMLHGGVVQLGVTWMHVITLG